MRVVGGKYRGKKLIEPEDQRIRPTSDRARESIFNILAAGSYTDGKSLPQERRVLDVFAGTGAFGIEAYSRGAACVWFLEKDRTALSLIQKNIGSLSETQGLTVTQRDALNPGTAAPGLQFDLIFLDPPYHSGAASEAIENLDQQNWIAPGSLIIVETDKKEVLDLPDRFSFLDERKYGKAKFSFYSAPN